MNLNSKSSKALISLEVDLNELITLLDTLPEIELLTNYVGSAACIEMFANWININFHMRERIKAYILGGSSPNIDTTDDFQTFIVALSMHELALYSLIFECWNYLKPLAVKKGLLLAKSKPKDCLRIIKTQEYNDVLVEIYRKNKRRSNRVLYESSNSAYKFNLNVLNSDTANLSPLRLKSSDEESRSNYSPLLILLLDVVKEYREVETSINTANLNYCNTLQAVLIEIKKLVHHKNKTR